MIKRLVATCALVFAISAPATGAVINYFEAGAPVDVPGLTGFTTTGAMMDGLQVTACFVQAGCETRSWAATGPNSGGVSGTDWEARQTGDTFTAPWTFENTGAGQLESLLLNGLGTLTIFDRTFGGLEGTPGSGLGGDWTTNDLPNAVINVTYLNPTGIGGNPPVGDLFQQVLVEFLDLTGPRVSFTFLQDTDNDARFFQVPEPSPLALFGLALLALGLVRRRFT
jgi:hypothetical protein